MRGNILQHSSSRCIQGESWSSSSCGMNNFAFWMGPHNSFLKQFYRTFGKWYHETIHKWLFLSIPDLSHHSKNSPKAWWYLTNGVFFTCGDIRRISHFNFIRVHNISEVPLLKQIFKLSCQWKFIKNLLCCHITHTIVFPFFWCTKICPTLFTAVMRHA
ncbi:2-succinylbenzoate--CoA ligase [Frankliniella fusca]|uniref:2-succinylbenzoate--CoA ligase n=1 Tax=Frankliniella fusca TaxID=407009 RepID=A0AAE1GWX5_9NEOP|nr:2-succinylbenzoate--CoA ligase [Frankliniella fusca]